MDENGQITAVAPGFAYITVSSPYVVSATNQCIVEVLPCQAMQFTDVDTSQWYHEGIDFMVSKGLMNGVGDNRFQPNGILTRGQLVTILHRMAGSPAAEKEAPFTDVASGRYYSEAVAWAYEAEIAKGISTTAFAPNAAVTREQLVTFLARYASWSGVEVKVSGDLNGYTDASSVSPYALEAMTWAVENGIIQGVTDTSLAPRGTATRAQVATIFMRYCQKFA